MELQILKMNTIDGLIIRGINDKIIGLKCVCGKKIQLIGNGVWDIVEAWGDDLEHCIGKHVCECSLQHVFDLKFIAGYDKGIREVLVP